MDADRPKAFPPTPPYPEIKAELWSKDLLARRAGLPVRLRPQPQRPHVVRSATYGFTTGYPWWLRRVTGHRPPAVSRCMPKSLRVCTESGCPGLTSRSSGRCDQHERERLRRQDSLRPSTAERGYGSDHQTDRAAFKRRILGGEVFACARCGKPILPGQAWDLDHTDDRAGYLGPSHAACNRATRRMTA